MDSQMHIGYCGCAVLSMELNLISKCPKHFVVKGVKVIMCWVNVVLGRLQIYLGIYKIIEDIVRYPTDSICT